MLYIELGVLCATRINYIGNIAVVTNQQVEGALSSFSFHA